MYKEPSAYSKHKDEREIKFIVSKEAVIDDTAPEDSKDKVWSIGKISEEFIDNLEFVEGLNTKASGEIVKNIQSDIITLQSNKQNKMDGELITTSKSIVSAINEVSNKINGLVDDSVSVTAEDRTWSIKKISDNFVDNNELNKSLSSKATKTESLELDNKIKTLSNNLEKELFVSYDKEQFVTIENSLNSMTGRMIIEGQTYQNLITNPLDSLIGLSSSTESKYEALVKKNTSYSLFFTLTNIPEKLKNITIHVSFSGGQVTTKSQKIKEGLNVFFIPNSGDDIRDLWIYYIGNSENLKFNLKSPVLLEGDYTNKILPPYIRGIESSCEKESKIEISSCGKNLVDGSFYYEKQFNSVVATGDYSAVGVRCKIPCQSLRKDITYKVKIVFTDETLPTSSFVLLRFFKDVGGSTINKTPNGSFSFSESEISSVKYFDIYWNGKGGYDQKKIKEILIVKAGGMDSFEPYQQSSIGVPLIEPLRSVKTSRDQILESGNLIRSIRKKEIDEKAISKVTILTQNRWNEEYSFFLLNVSAAFGEPAYPNLCFKNNSCASNNFIQSLNWSADEPGKPREIICINANPNYIGFRMRVKELKTNDLNGFKQWLTEHPTTVYYVLENPEISQLPLGNTNLKMFKNITNIYSTNYISPLLTFKAPNNLFSLNNENADQINLLSSAVNRFAKTIESMKPIFLSTTEGIPTNPTIGQSYFDRALGIPLFWNGSNWVKSDGMLPVNTLPEKNSGGNN